MLAIFCLRLACGLAIALLVLNPNQVPPRFFRVQYLTALALVAVAGFFLGNKAYPFLWLLLGVSMFLTFAGSVIWHIEGHPGQHFIMVLANCALLATLLLAGNADRGEEQALSLSADDFASAAVLGAATSAMLMGHSYLIAPAMSLRPLNRLLGALGVTLLARMILASLGLYWWTRLPTAGNLETEALLWLTVRWIVGFVGPLVLGWLAWETARIRSTQSATGILYVVVILAFLGELISQVLVGILKKPGQDLSLFF